MIYIVIYKNVAKALPLNSMHSRDWMHNVHSNIIVQRHNNLIASPFWAHHEVYLTMIIRKTRDNLTMNDIENFGY